MKRISLACALLLAPVVATPEAGVAAASQADHAAPPLTDYVGHYPFDEVAEVALLDQPAVRAAQSVEVEIPTGTTQCAFSAWTSSVGDAPVPIRAEPSETATVLGYALASNGGGDDAISGEFEVTEARSGWLKIDHQTIELPQDGDPVPLSPPPYEGAGWIPSGAALIGIQSALGYASPDPDSSLVIDLGDQWLTDVATIDAIRACSGAWLLVDYHRNSEPGSAADFYAWPADRPERGTAWFRGVCSNQRTTCDMVSVDRRP